jgi:hypothetical protein
VHVVEIPRDDEIAVSLLTLGAKRALPLMLFVTDRKGPAMTPDEILALPLPKNDADAATVRDYLRALLLTWWQQGEIFSGKKPFGNSDWEEELLAAIPEDATVGRDPQDLIEDAIKAL